MIFDHWCITSYYVLVLIVIVHFNQFVFEVLFHHFYGRIGSSIGSIVLPILPVPVLPIARSIGRDFRRDHLHHFLRLSLNRLIWRRRFFSILTDLASYRLNFAYVLVWKL